MIPTHHAGDILPTTKGFFPHDFTQITSVMGESVIGHGIGGKHIPTKWRASLKPDAMTHCKSVTGVSDDRPVCHHPISQPHDV